MRVPSGRPCHVSLGSMWTGHLWMGRAVVECVSRMSGPLWPSASPMVQCRSLLVREKVSGGPMGVGQMWQCGTGFC